MPRLVRTPVPAAVLALMLWAPAAGAEAAARDADAPRRPDGPLAPASLRATTMRLMEFGPRPVGAEGHGRAASYVGGRFLLGGLKPILTDTFPCRIDEAALADKPPAAPAAASSGGPAACGSVVAFGHALPLADAWSLMKGEAEAFTFAHPPRPDLEAALEEAARDEGVARLTPFDVFKRPSPLFPRAVVRCLLRRLVRREAGDEADDPRARARAMAGLLRRLARAHEAVLVTAPLDMRPAPGAGRHGADESASLAVLCGLARHVVCESPPPRRRTLICVALDGHWRGAAGARSLARRLGPPKDGVPRGGLPDAARADAATADRAAGVETRRAGNEGEPRRAGTGEAAEDAQLAALLGPSAAAARAPALAEALRGRPADAALVAEAEDVLVRLLRLEPYAVRLVVCLDLSSGGRSVAVHLAAAGGEAGGEVRPWLAAAVRRAAKRGPAPFVVGTTAAGDASGPAPAAAVRGQTALAATGRPAVLLRTADAPRDRWFTAGDTVERMDFPALADQARTVAALVEEILASDDLPARE